MSDELVDSLHSVQTADGKNLSLLRKVPRDVKKSMPVLMVHGAGVRSKIFSRNVADRGCRQFVQQQ